MQGLVNSLGACAIAVACCSALIAASPGPAQAGQLISQMVHTAWRSRDGAPAGIKTLIQSVDGTLWIGSQSGLFQFDGKTFTSIVSYAGTPLPAGPVVSLLSSRDGAVWAGFVDGEIVRIFQGTMRQYRVNSADQNEHVVSLRQGNDGTIWCITSSRLLRLRSGAFVADEVPRLPIRNFATDALGNAWLGTQNGLFERHRGQPGFIPVPGSFGIILALTAMPGGGVLVSDFDVSTSRGRTRRIDEAGTVIGRLAGHDVAYDTLIDKDGTVWFATQTDGLRTTELPKTNDLAGGTGDEPDTGFRRSDGLTSNAVYTVLQDRDGNIWTGTRTGLDRFRLATLSALSNDNDAAVWFMCSGIQGDVWIANTAGKLYHVNSNAPPQPQLVDKNINALACGRDNDAWFASPASYWHAIGERITQTPKMPGSQPYTLFQILVDTDGTLLANESPENNNGGLWRFRGDTWSQLGPPQEDAGFQKIFLDAATGLWAIPKAAPWVLKPIGNKPATDGHGIPPEVGRVGPIIASSFGLMLGGQRGLAISAGKDFNIVILADPSIANGISGLVQARNEDVWFIASRGIVHITKDQIARAIRSPDAAIQGDLIQENDFVGRSNACSCFNAAAIGSDGRLWFAGLTGVVSVDPSKLPPRPRPPLLRLTSMLADEQSPDARNEFQPNPRTMRIDYTGVNLSEPGSVIYRYKLDGADKTWQDVGRRTEATYTSLGPRRYTFEVMASNGDGNWTSPLSVPLTVLPSFYQTYWFIVLSSASFCALLWFVQSAYVRNVVALTGAKADARADERIRIAQDLHDTLLQGVQGLVLHVHVAAVSMPQDHPSAVMLQRALSAANSIIVEGRESVSALRSTRLMPGGLVDALEGVGRDLNIADPVYYSVKCSESAESGRERLTLAAHVADQVFYVVREAVANAFRHARAANITVVLAYRRRAFTVRCSDDGIGFAPADVQDSRRTGHWGLRGMRERVTEIGGRLTFRSAALKGTTVFIVIPARQAYRRTAWGKKIARLWQKRRRRGLHTVFRAIAPPSPPR